MDDRRFFRIVTVNTNDQTLGDFFRIVKKRAKPAGAASVSVFAIMLVVIFLLPSVYESTAVLLIEQSDIQPELLGGAGSREYVEQRLQRTRQQVLTPENITRIIKRHGLFESTETNSVPDEWISIFNDNVSVEPQVTGVIDPRTMREANLTYAFELSYRDQSPEAAKNVTADLAELFIRSNIVRAQQDAQRAIAFLQEEADKLAADLRLREERLAEFRQENLSNLPENREQNLFRARDLERDIARVDDDLRDARARKELLETQLRDIPRDRPLLDERGQRVISGAERLDAAQQELVAALARYSENHPDVKRLRREIETLSYGDTESQSESNPSNPLYAQIKAQIESSNIAIRDLNIRRTELAGQVSRVQAAIFRSPEYEQQYTDLIRDYELVKSQYEAMRQRQRAAEVSRKAAGSEGIESYVVVREPFVSASPIEPARGQLALLALIVGIAVLLAVATILDYTDKTVRGASDVTNSGVAIIGQIPRIS